MILTIFGLVVTLNIDLIILTPNQIPHYTLDARMLWTAADALSAVVNGGSILYPYCVCGFLPRCAAKIGK